MPPLEGSATQLEKKILESFEVNELNIVRIVKCRVAKLLLE